MFAVKKYFIALLCIFTLMMTPSVTFAGNTWNKIKNNFKQCEIKIQGCTTEQWAGIVNPKRNALYANAVNSPSKLTTKKKVLYTVGAAIVVGGLIYVIANNNDSEDPIAYAAD
jgi:hypothetical protein